MAPTIRYSVDTSDVLAAIKVRAGKLGNSALMRSEVGEAISKSLQLRAEKRFFEFGADTGPEGWEDLAESTPPRKRRAGAPDPDWINVRMGGLMDWIIHEHASVSSPVTSSILVTYPREAPFVGKGPSLGGAFTYAQTGNSRQPARPVVILDEEDQANVMAIIGTWLESM